MGSYSLTHIPDVDLLRNLAALVGLDRATTAEMLAHIAEVDARRLYVPAACSSMFDYCVRILGLSEDAAYKRILVARAGRVVPALFEAVADGRLHFTGARMLAAHLTSGNAEDLLTASEHKTKSEIEELLARRFPRTESMPLLMSMPAAPLAPNSRSIPAPSDAPNVANHSTELAPDATGRTVQDESCQLVPGPVDRQPKVVPVAAERFLLQFMIGRRVREKLRYAQDLTSHQINPGDLETLLEVALDLLITKREQTKFAATALPPRTKPLSRRVQQSLESRIYLPPCPCSSRNTAAPPSTGPSGCVQSPGAWRRRATPGTTRWSWSRPWDTRPTS